jgi:hypothetical protein
MRFIALIFALLVSCTLSSAQVPMTGAGLGAPSSGGGGNPFALDGTPVCANSGGSAALSVGPFTNTYPNAVVYVGVTTNGGPVISISGVSGMASRVSYFNPGAPTNYDTLLASVQSSPLSGVTAIVNTTTSSFITACIFAFSGAHSAAPYDGNAAIPTTNATGPCSFTTSNANDILIAWGRLTAGNSITAGSGWTLINGLNFSVSEYMGVSSTQSGTTATIVGDTFSDCVGDAIIKGP